VRTSARSLGDLGVFTFLSLKLDGFEAARRRWRAPAAPTKTRFDL
jgi:hypothetical protein